MMSSLPLIALLAGGGSAWAGSSASGEEFLSTFEAVPPNVLFVLDRSSNMNDDCGELGDTGDPTSMGTTSGQTCYAAAKDAIDKLTQHFDWAYYGVVGTADSANTNTFYEIAPLGSSHSAISAALASSTADNSGTDTRNLAEVLGGLSDNYFTLTSVANSGVSFSNAPITYWCQESHIIVIASEFPNNDQSPTEYTSGTSLSRDVKCNSQGITTGADLECKYDNAVHALYNRDHRSDFDGTQNLTVHTVAIKARSNSVAEDLFGNSVTQISGNGIYNVANQGNEILGSLMMVLSQIRTGFFSRSTPVVSSDGAYLLYAFYELVGDARYGGSNDGALAEGHLRAYEVGTDPTDTSTYGQVQYNGDSQFGGAIWDAGDLLVSRPVVASESQPDDRDGLGQRDIYTFVPEMMALTSTAIYSEARSDHRMGFDYEFVTSLVGYSAVLDNFLKVDATDTAYDLNDDDAVDTDDMQALVNFARGLPSAAFRYLGSERGYWKLGDSPHSVPVVVTARDDVFTTDPSYRAFLAKEEAAGVPDIVLIAANDGMLHAFRLKDDPTTSCTTYNSGLGSDEDCDEAGEELWAWMPAYVLYRDPGETWSGRLLDLMWYGRTFLFDGSPVVEDVWIDADDDGVKKSNGTEWHRIVVVQQGKGGPVSLALDITNTQAPEFLWEQTNTSDYSAMGYTVSRPVIANVYDAEDLTDTRDRWVAMWGAGRAVPNASSTAYYKSSEPNLYMWHVSKDYWGTPGKSFAVTGSNASALHPGHSTYGSSLDMDGDGAYEYAYISGAIAAVDADSDGDVDVLYFPVTVSYEPGDMGDPDGNGTSGLSDVADPGHTWMYKAILDVTNPDDPTWCEFYDPQSYISVRPEIYYAATTSWHADGSLGVYWGSGTPYSRTTSEYGWFFAMKDNSPRSCAEASPITDCGAYGAYKLDAGEGLTGDPIVYAGTVYFSTYVPDTDDPYCTKGKGRIYGLAFDDCSDSIDTDGDGVASNDPAYLEVDGYPSAVSVSDQGTIFYGTSNPDTSQSGGSAVGQITAQGDPFMGTKTMGLREVF